MTFSKQGVQITETEVEFLLAIYASQKERAKSMGHESV
jgi:hypothetical protein